MFNFGATTSEACVQSQTVDGSSGREARKSTSLQDIVSLKPQGMRVQRHKAASFRELVRVFVHYYVACLKAKAKPERHVEDEVLFES